LHVSSGRNPVSSSEHYQLQTSNGHLMEQQSPPPPMWLSGYDNPAHDESDVRNGAIGNDYIMSTPPNSQ